MPPWGMAKTPKESACHRAIHLGCGCQLDRRQSTGSAISPAPSSGNQVSGAGKPESARATAPGKAKKPHPGKRPPEALVGSTAVEAAYNHPGPRRKGHTAAPWNTDYKRKWQERQDADALLARQVAEAVAAGQGEQVLAAIDAARCRADFSHFCQRAWHVIEPATALVWNWHHQMICDVLQALFECWVLAKADPAYVMPMRNAVLNVCPTSLKSRLTVVLFPVWCWLRDPSVKFICLSVNEDATLRDARAARDLIRSDWYQDAFQPTWKISGDQDAVSSYGNTEGGERVSKHSGSEAVGLHADAILYDDPNNPLESENKSERDKINKLWETNIYNRVNDGMRSLRIGIQQRTNAEDWTGRVLQLQGTWSPENRDGWLHVVLPAEFEAARRFVAPTELAERVRWRSAPLADPRTTEGETIDPVRMPPAYLAGERHRWAGTGQYAGQMQQRPADVEGGAIKRAWWGFCRLDGGVRPQFDGVVLDRPRPALTDQDVAPYLIRAGVQRPGQWDMDWVAISIDPAAKRTERGANWGLLVIAGKGGRRFVLDDRTRRGDILEILEVLRDMIRLWHPDKILIEDKAAGDDFKTMLRSQMATADLPMVVLEMIEPGSAGKEERLDSCKPALANQMIHLLEGAPWLEEFVAEIEPVPQWGAE